MKRMKRAKTLVEYQRNEEARREAISENRARRIRRVPSPPIGVPEKVGRPLIPVAYEQDGTYGGTLRDVDELPAGMVIKWEEAYR